MKRLFYAAALAAVCGGGIAIAQTPAATPQAGVTQPAPRGPGRMMLRMDTNKDGVIAKSEAIAAATKRFDRIDANKDGRIDATEMAAMKGRRGPGRGHGHHRGGPDMPPPPPPATNG